MDFNTLQAVARSTAGQASYDSSRAAAEAARFSDKLKAAQQNLQAANGTSTADTAQAAAQDKKLRDACAGFEEMFMEIMYKQMRETVPEDSLFGNSNANKIFESMRDSELMKQAAASGGVGLADMLYKQMKKNSEAIVVPNTKK